MYVCLFCRVPPRWRLAPWKLWRIDERHAMTDVEWGKITCISMWFMFVLTGEPLFKCVCKARLIDESELVLRFVNLKKYYSDSKYFMSLQRGDFWGRSRWQRSENSRSVATVGYRRNKCGAKYKAFAGTCMLIRHATFPLHGCLECEYLYLNNLQLVFDARLWRLHTRFAWHSPLFQFRSKHQLNMSRVMRPKHHSSR